MFFPKKIMCSKLATLTRGFTWRLSFGEGAFVIAQFIRLNEEFKLKVPITGDVATVGGITKSTCRDLNCLYFYSSLRKWIFLMSIVSFNLLQGSTTFSKADRALRQEIYFQSGRMDYTYVLHTGGMTVVKKTLFQSKAVNSFLHVNESVYDSLFDSLHVRFAYKGLRVWIKYPTPITTVCNCVPKN
jgi:hypothetical protein